MSGIALNQLKDFVLREFRYIGNCAISEVIMSWFRGYTFLLGQTSSLFHKCVFLMLFPNRRVEHPFTARVIPCRVLTKSSEASYRCASGFNKRIV